MAKKLHEMIAEFVAGSRIFVQVLTGEAAPKRIWIEIHGTLAHIPSHKNNRHPKFPGIDRVVLAKLRALDVLFIREVRRQGLNHPDVFFGQKRIFVSVLLAATKRATNEDNALTTIKDWLEPRTKVVGGKNKKKRGWGIGLILDDVQARGLALKSDDLSMIMPHTRIVIEPFEVVRESMEVFFNNNGNVL